MACSNVGKRPAVFQIDICPTKMVSKTGEKEKEYKDGKMKAILSTICALLNSGGGKLSLRYGKKSSRELVGDCLRMIEQQVARVMTSCVMVSHMTVNVHLEETIVILESCSNLITLNYNLCLPSETQVLTVLPSEPVENVKEVIMQRKIPQEKVATAGSPCQYFIKGQILELHESCAVQLKNLKASPSKRVKLADRITGKTNKFLCYVSAFANLYGGHIYYGISDTGKVEGEEISSEQGINAIINQVTKAIDGMICSFSGDKPQRRKQWDIYFVPVYDQKHNQIPLTFVIVIYVAPCLGGIFTKRPESYYIVQGKLQKMSFPDWWANFNSSTRCTRIHSVPSHLPCVAWSSEKNRKIYRFLTSKLVQCRNDQMMEKFERLSRLAIDKFPDSVAPLVVMSEEVTVASKNCSLKNANSLLRAFMGSVNGNEMDRLIFDVIELYLKSRLERAEGNIKESHKIATVGLQKMRLIPAEFITVRFYVHAATVATILASNERDPQAIDDLRHEVKQCLDYASRDAKMVRTSDSRIDIDLEQKLRIYRAEAYMGCSLTGAAPTDSTTITSEDLDNAASELTAVHQSNLNGHIPTQFRKSQFLLAQSDLYYLRSRCPQNGESCSEYLNTAYQYAEEALALATKLKFEELIPYANKRLKVLRESFNSAPDVDEDTDLKILEDLEDQ